MEAKMTHFNETMADRALEVCAWKGCIAGRSDGLQVYAHLAEACSITPPRIPIPLALTSRHVLSCTNILTIPNGHPCNV